jgi:hypothetical protein
VARKKTTSKKSSAQAALPKGFTSIGGFGQSWPVLSDPKEKTDTKPGDAVQGIVIEYDSIKVTRKRGGKNVTETVHNLKLELKDGTVITLWDSATLKALFKDDYTDFQLWVRYDGLAKAKRGQNPAKLFTIAYNE